MLEHQTDLFSFIQPEDFSPVLVNTPHSGTIIPEECADEIACERAVMLRDTDLYTDQLYAGAPALGCTLMSARISRYIVDLNRPAGDVDADSVEGWTAAAPPAPRGMIWRLSTNNEPVLRKPLTREQYRRRLDAYYRPYQDHLLAALKTIRDRHGFAVLVDGHSMPSVGRAQHSDEGRRRADIVPGDADGASCGGSLTRLVTGHFRGCEYSVALNDPYKGGFNTRHYGRPAERIHAIQIELNRDLYMDEETLEIRSGGFARLKTALEGLLRRINLWRP
ncbi:MAG: hypothetical protein GMKNLPBB_02845 [Myxococcota bacterium]|nr:hypothetical protein [Myxococcota bacterium]